MFTLPQQQLPEINKARADKTLRVDALETGHQTVLDTGELQVIDNQVDQTTGTIRLKADFPNTDLQLWPGQFVNVQLLLKTLDQVVVIPTSAVQRGPDGAFVYVIGEGSKVSMRPVTVAQQDDADAVISQGLTASEQVVTAGFARLKDGAEVKVGEPTAKTPVNSTLPGEPQADATGLAPGSDTASIARAAEQPQPAAKDGEGKHKRGEGKHRGQRKDASAAPGSTPGSTP
jgi:multidrug efflux system membrane fusion protein